MTLKTEPSLNREADPALSHPCEYRSVSLALQDGSGHNGQAVLLVPGFPVGDERLCGAFARVSILYPLDCEEFRLPASDNFCLGFLAPKRPLELLSKLDQNSRKAVLFGCGFCSVVIVSNEYQTIENIIAGSGGNLYGWENWCVQNGKIADSKSSAETDRAFKLKQIDIHLGLGVSNSTGWLINELFLNFNRFYQSAQRYAPFLVDELEALAFDVNELISEISNDEIVRIRVANPV